jgi:leucyl aminopeptidase
MMALFISRQGVVASASHQIATSIATLLYMVPLALGIACSARVGFWIGANEYGHAEKAARTGLKLTLLLALVLSSVLAFGKDGLASLFSSDVVVTMAGHTVEVGNTDAEGRLVLADIMHYVQEKYKITHMIDIATLTGAIVVALGESYAGLFSNNKEMSDHLYEIGEETGDLLWKMPMNKNYDRQIDSKIADISNDGGGRGAGSCTAAHFLQNFVKTDCKWAHLDIAGMAWNKNGTPLAPCGATGFGVKIFNHFVKKHFET